MSRATKVCDCFLDVAVYCLSINNLVYADFFPSLCANKRQKKFIYDYD